MTAVHAQRTPRFDGGACTATKAAMGVLARFNMNPYDVVMRHLAGDWGAGPADDNERAIREGLEIRSTYELAAPAERATVVVITEADRSETCVYLPKELP